MKTKFYEFNQNNSGGYFDINENVCHRVIIEAKDDKEALAKFEPMIENQSGSCPCCGERWSSSSPDEINISEYLFKDIEGYAQFMANKYGFCEPDVIIHYADGTKKEVFTQKA